MKECDGLESTVGATVHLFGIFMYFFAVSVLPPHSCARFDGVRVTGTPEDQQIWNYHEIKNPCVKEKSWTFLR